MTGDKINRFLAAQNQLYLKALEEVRNGSKTTHWMWFIFPQLEGLGLSDTSKYYSIRSLDEAADYLRHPVLGRNLIEISQAVLNLEGKSAFEIFGSPDDKKLCSCMTLFSILSETNPVFEEVINKYFGGFLDKRTLEILGK